MKIEIRRVEPGYKAVQQLHAQPKAVDAYCMARLRPKT